MRQARNDGKRARASSVPSRPIKNFASSKSFWTVLSCTPWNALSQLRFPTPATDTHTGDAKRRRYQPPRVPPPAGDPVYVRAELQRLYNAGHKAVLPSMHTLDLQYFPQDLPAASSPSSASNPGPVGRPMETTTLDSGDIEMSDAAGSEACGLSNGDDSTGGSTGKVAPSPVLSLIHI